jgi:hypothetical protein
LFELCCYYVFCLLYRVWKEDAKVDYFAIPAFDQEQGDVVGKCKKKGFMGTGDVFVDVRESMVYVNVEMNCYDLVSQDQNPFACREELGESCSRAQLPASEEPRGATSHITSPITRFKTTSDSKHQPYGCIHSGCFLNIL